MPDATISSFERGAGRSRKPMGVALDSIMLMSLVLEVAFEEAVTLL